MFITRMCTNRKPIAWVLFFIFYFQMVSPAMANRLAAPYRVPAISYHKSITAGPAENQLAYPSANVVKESGIPKDSGNVYEKKKLLPAIVDNLRNNKLTDGPGPTQPEMQSFQSVNTNNMVDLFTGDFSYNIPLLDVGGYPVSMHYNSGITMDQEASWVGLGWNINAGTINRTMRGLPDDFNGSDKIQKTLSVKDNRTVGVTLGGNTEIFGKSTSASASVGVFHNTYRGWGTTTSINAGINAGSGAKGPLSGNIGLTNNSQSGLDISPSFGYRIGKAGDNEKGVNIGIGTNYNSRIGIQALQMSMQIRQQNNTNKSQPGKTLLYGLIPDAAQISFATPSFTPSMSIPFTSNQMTYTVKLGSESWGLHKNVFVSGDYSNQYIADNDKLDSFPAYGYLYYQESANQPKALLDFNREKEVAFRGTTPTIAIPGYTYDIYSITGEGTGGMFRPYRGDIGMIYDHTMATKSGSGRISVDLGFGTTFHGGVDLNKVFASTKNNPWLQDNVMARYVGFKKSDSLYESVYFKNPGEKVTVDQGFYNKIGDDKLVRVQLSPPTLQNSAVVSATHNLTLFSNARPLSTITLDATAYKTQRDKRTQVISYLTAQEAKVVGLDKKIKSYFINSFPSFGCTTNYKLIDRVDATKKAHHLSEISVLNTDGRRYIYGTPAYNVQQNDVSFSVEKAGADIDAGLVAYNSTDNTPNNSSGKDHYYSKETIPGYAHSFLLTGIVSPDYVDITGDGITDDDNGNAVKFNYTQVYGNTNPYLWRAPFDAGKASYNEGQKSYNRDDRGSYTFGMKEVWYMNSIESKTMMATFVLETDSIRQDSYGTLGENGGLSAAQKLYRLREINLYTKADILKNGIAAAKPIKTVHFEYSYELCPGVPSSNDTGKLTLKKVWFTYNKNDKGKLNPYIFTYSSTNPSFNNKSYDRWGNYKSPDDNPGTTGNKLTNGEYPYSLQKSVNGWDSTKAANNVAAWTLNQIKLPSGGLMKVAYESDDYAYVQNRRAMQMFSVAGFGSDSTSSPSNNLYPANKSGKDYQYVFIKLNDAVASKQELLQRYFEGIKKFYFKLYVKMTSDIWGSGYEQIPCFADMEDCNIKIGSSNKMIWIRLAKINSNSPLATAALQYLRLNLPNKAYPLSEPGDKVNLGDMIGMLLSVGANFATTLAGYDKSSRSSNWCNNIDTTKSFLRLDNPDYKKLGGGLRVKSVQIFDNWQTMTTQTESSYGQTYDYSTTTLINDVPSRISSGVSSYEPALGKEENPFFNPIEYAEKMALLGPTDYVYTDEPLGESFFPSSVIGYSKITVQTINNTKKSANGTDVTEFYTANEFPTIFENTVLDNESKKSFANPLGNLFKFDAKRYITLSQGFKVELNDMHGKVKSQSTFAQTDLQHPISYTYNYYKQDNDNALNKHLSNSVNTADSSTGAITSNNQMGKDIDILIDIREQTSRTVSASVQLNIDFAAPWVFVPSIPNLPTFETDRYRSIAVTKIINRYAILDSVVHFDKGSKISTANMVYDGETGNVLLSRTQNEFDDPVYSFNYPAYWAYSGMEGAYKNIGATFKNVSFLNGKISYKGFSETGIQRYFESGDELLLTGRVKKGRGNEICKGEDFSDPVIYRDTSIKIWAVDLSKAGSGSTGIFFVDKDGIPVTASSGTTIKIIRSGKRNLQATSAGAITSLQSPVKLVNGINRFVFDSTTSVIAASAIKFKDFWRVDSNSYRKDTMMRVAVQSDLVENYYSPSDLEVAKYYRSTSGNIRYTELQNQVDFFGRTQSFGTSPSNSKERNKSAMLFDQLVNGYQPIPKNSVISSAVLHLFPASVPQVNGQSGITNNAYISASTGPWVKDLHSQLPPSAWPGTIGNFYNNTGLTTIFSPYRLQTGTSNPNSASYESDGFSVGSDTMKRMVQSMVDNFYKFNRRPSIVIDQQMQVNTPGVNIMSFKYSKMDKFTPYIDVSYYLPCDGGTSPVYSATPVPGYYCYSQPRDSFICKPNINDTAMNPYRWGIWGNWQVDRAYSYYNSRKDSMVNGSSVTNIRKDGEIKSFVPYWAFTTAKMLDSQDSSRWVWNSEINMINSKGLELQNHDPLNRYNSAQYGYSQTLPVAVAQNSRNREMVFDGFEDYGYTTNNCSTCPQNRFINFVNGGTLVDTISHTGIYSLRVAGGLVDSVTVPIVSNAIDTAISKVIGKASSTLISDTTVAGGGNGLTVQYFPYSGTTQCRATTTINNLDTNYSQPPAGCSYKKQKFRAEFYGYIQPKYSEFYTFYGDANDLANIYINNVRISANLLIESHPTAGVIKLNKIFLYAGQIYPIRVKLWNVIADAHIHLKWESASQLLEIVPKAQLYTSGTAQPNTISVTSRLCVKLDTLKQSNISLKNFSPLQGTKMIVGAWVKEKNNNPDTVSAFRNTQIQIVFNDGTTVTLQPSGNIIEGWQRIEEIVNIPATATQMKVKLMSTNSGIATYFDDIRIHPFNSNLKSFVYNPVNLRLMAELDENNYASFYEYDDDGTLIRVKKETERGVKTIKETRSALLKQ